jgi:putative glutamine amidotransferase
MVIAVSKLAPNYESWLRKVDSEMVIEDMYSMAPEEAMNAAAKASGILFTGGCDIHPLMYGKPEEFLLCKNIDDRRDALETALIELAFDRKIPIFGICRGQQMLNVALKGSLFADINTSINSGITHFAEKDANHEVSIIPGSRIAGISGLLAGTVNSSHHQAVDKLASGLKATAFSTDLIIEAVEADPAVHPFCIAVQWHPERMNFDHPLSGRLGRAFVEAAKKMENGKR